MAEQILKAQAINVFQQNFRAIYQAERPGWYRFVWTDGIGMDLPLRVSIRDKGAVPHRNFLIMPNDAPTAPLTAALTNSANYQWAAGLGIWTSGGGVHKTFCFDVFLDENEEIAFNHNLVDPTLVEIGFLGPFPIGEKFGRW